MFEQTYKLEKPPEEAMQWRECESLIRSEWNALLNRTPSPSEREIQALLEQHPSLVPGAFGLRGNPSGHYPMYCGVISQPPLPTYNARIPDFMWLAQDSATDQPVLVEIEAPAKKWFTKVGNQTKDLTQALHQIVQWKAWFAVPHNTQMFKAFYGLDREACHKRYFRPSYVLIYGRRAEANAEPRLTEQRAHLAQEDVTIMTYDRLAPDADAKDFVCLEVKGPDGYRAVSVPPTLTWSPFLAEDRARIRDLDKAIVGNAHISEQRKAFLVRRLAYWNE